MRDRSQKFELVIRPKGRTPADEYPHRGVTWIEGRDNSSYVVDIVNHTPGRVLAVVSVDGVGVLDGQPASFDSRGYVLQPHQTLSIPGWAVSGDQAAEFYFSGKLDSYASQMGQGGNQGVIGSAFFEEKPKPIPAFPAPSWSLARSTVGSQIKGLSASVSANATSTSMSSDIGTGFGEAVEWRTISTTFERASLTPSATLVLHYGSADHLRKMGIQLKSRSYSNSASQAFPGNSQEYCAPPPSWVLKSRN